MTPVSHFARVLLLLIVATTVLVSAGCLVIGGSSGIRGSGNVTTETRDLEPFESIVLHGSVEMEVTLGPTHSVTVEADDNLIDLLQTRTTAKELMIDVRESYRSRHGLKIRVVTPSLTNLVTMGSGDVSITQLDADRFSLHAQGSGDIEASGSVGRLELQGLGSGNIDFDAVEAETAVVNAIGSGNVRVRAEKKLEIRSSGSGNVTYSGSVEDVTTTSNGSGRILRSEESR